MGLTAPPSVAQALRALLADDTWHSMAEIVAHAGRLVRPEVALVYVARNGPGMRRMSLAARVELGRRVYLAARLHQMGARGEGAGWQRRWRLLPPRDCIQCGRAFRPDRPLSQHCSAHCWVMTGNRTRKAKVGA